MIGEEILADIDKTLDQLIQNAEALNKAAYQELTNQETDAFQKTQESLLAHLISMDELLEKKQKTIKVPNKKSASYKIQEKLLKFEKINGTFVKSAAQSFRIIQCKTKPRKRPCCFAETNKKTNT